MFGFLFRLCERLRVPSFNTLLLVYEHHFPQELHNHSDPSPQDSFLRTLLATEVGFMGEENQAKRHVCCRPLPFGTLVHWRVLVGLVSLVPTDSREAIRQRVELCSSQGLVEREAGLLADCLPLVCDSYLHWDSLSLRYPRTPLQQILLEHPDVQHKDFRVDCRGCVLLARDIPNLGTVGRPQPQRQPRRTPDGCYSGNPSHFH